MFFWRYFVKTSHWRWVFNVKFKEMILSTDEMLLKCMIFAVEQNLHYSLIQQLRVLEGKWQWSNVSFQMQVFLQWASLGQTFWTTTQEDFSVPASWVASGQNNTVTHPFQISFPDRAAFETVYVDFFFCKENFGSEMVMNVLYVFLHFVRVGGRDG